MNPNETKKIFDYNFWVFNRIRESISQISDQQFVKEIDDSTGSIRIILVSVMSSKRIWMSMLRRFDILRPLVFADFDTISKTGAKRDELRNEPLGGPPYPNPGNPSSSFPCGNG